MELIEAFEKLSFHVKTNPGRFMHTNSDLYVDPKHSEGLSFEPISSSDWQYPPQASNSHNDHQLNQFDYSIDTLFSQINDLDNLTSAVTNSYHDTDHRSKYSQAQRRPPLGQTAGSLETSQEEDSDNSSQKSAHELEQAIRGHDPIEDLMSDLMGRDIGSITDSVRRICRILALGSEIETIYKACDKNNSPTSSNTARQSIDSSTCRSLCESFLSLYSNEPHICRLPTFKRFAHICHTLLQQVNYIGSTKPMELDRIPACASDNSCSRDDEDQMCLDDARDTLDCVLLACDQSQLEANWTDNKLYINNHEFKN